MRPDEWARTSVERFNAAVQMRQAYEAGVADAKSEAEQKEASKQHLKTLGFSA